MKPQIWWQTLLCCFAAVMFLTLGVLAADIVDSGTCGADGDNLTWMLDSDGVLTISGKGEMDGWAFSDDIPWYKSRQNITNVIIENGVTSIGSAAFSFCLNLTSISIPDSIANIGSNVFWNSENLTTIEVSSNNSIYSSVNGVLFDKNQSTLILYPHGKEDTIYAIPDTVTIIVNMAFAYCNKLEEVTIPNSVTEICERLFYNCESLKSITIPDSVTSIANEAFENCSGLKNVIIGNNVTTIGAEAFASCNSLESVIIGNSVTTIGVLAFNSCDSLTNVTIPDSVTTIGGYSFAYCDNLKSVTIGTNVTHIEDGVFRSSPNVTLHLYANSRAHTYAMRKGIAYEFISDEVGTVRAGTAKTVSVTAETCDVTLDCSSANISAGAAYRILYALCDEHGQLLSVGSADVTFDASASADFTVEGVQAGLTCRIFLLNDKTSPQCAATQLTFVE